MIHFAAGAVTVAVLVLAGVHPNGLNRHWIKNVRHWTAKVRQS